MPRTVWFKLMLGAVAVLSAVPALPQEAAPEAEPAPAPEPQEAPPLPFHTIEGYGGGAITPFAYLVNPGSEDCVWGAPSAALSFVNARQKDLTALTVTETLFGRIELGYGGDRLGLGTLPGDIDAYSGHTLGIDEAAVWLHNFNVRALLVKENDCLFGFQAPAITAGIHFKYNADIENVDRELGGALTNIGYRHSSGQDFTLTASKTFGHLLLCRPVIASAGLRLSEAADLGFLGFGDKYHATFEGNVAWLPWDKILVAYEFRQKANPFSGTIANGAGGYLVGDEDNWHAFDLGLIVNPHSTLVAGWGMFGNLANTEANNSWFVQLKYEF